MKGFIVRSFGGPEAMLWEDLPTPQPGPGQVLVQVHASGINFAETRMRAGDYSGQELPFVMGMEGAGIVLETGEGVEGFKPGDRVFGRARGAVTPRRCCSMLNTSCICPKTCRSSRAPPSR